ncbi:mitochondrial resolvase Ydc2 [Aspergillus ambiguus]|uniref:uncharacterized protein n=1 Tax=Aspergillus ambiguus TaxID=176160 RepID=UPI003CCCF5D1
MLGTPRLLSAHPWLHTLKTAQLQRIAQATGIQSSGPKGPLIQRIETELAECNPHREVPTGRSLSILSIDMGIRNLAFAHLLVPAATPRTSPDMGGAVQPMLNAWRRLSIADLAPALRHGHGHGENPSKEKEDFSPGTYAPLAYALLTSLLDTYQPTHVLIERQRFRSGGGSAVQEWTLRVGVFEGMLYAVLYALRQERMRAAPVVVGVEPQRVVRYWGGGTGKGLSSREGKKVKIDLVGGWLDAAATDMSIEMGGKVRVAEEDEVQRWVDGYLDRWKGKRVRKGGSMSGDGVEIGKLDDLADCLLQGVTWLEWQTMRDRITREGVDAVGV